MPKPTVPTLSNAIGQVAAQLEEPISFDEFAQRVLTIKPSTAKSPNASIRNELSYQLLEHNLIYLDDRKRVVAPIQPLIRGVRFRHRVSEAEAAAGIMRLDYINSVFLAGRAINVPQTIQTLSLLDEAGKKLRLRPGAFSEQVSSFFDKQVHTIQRTGLELLDWFLHHELKADDSILVTIEAWDPPCWRLVYEPASRRAEAGIEAAIVERNQEMVDTLYDLLEAAHDESIHLREAIITAHLRMGEPTAYPGDSWYEAFKADKRMRTDGFYIAYSDGRMGFLDSFLEEDSKPQIKTKQPSQTEAQQVYRFKAEFTYRKSIWRRIEILGKQTLYDLNRSLVHAFQHDNDHMGGFWRRIRRGNSNRFREVALGTVAPWGGQGDNENLQIAAIGLQPKDEIKYVYDFGDSHQHLLTLEEILPNPALEETVPDYPRVTEQNKPKYKHCEDCKRKGKTTVAAWVCYECSDKERREMVYCEACASKFHEEHYVVELVN